MENFLIVLAAAIILIAGIGIGMKIKASPATAATLPPAAVPPAAAPAATPTAATSWRRLRPYSGLAAALLIGIALATTVWWLARPAPTAQVPPNLLERVERLEKAAATPPATPPAAPARPAPTRPAPAPARPAPAPAQPAPAQAVAQPPAEQQIALVAEQQRVAALQQQVVALQKEVVALATQQLQQQVAQQQQSAQVQATGFTSVSAATHEGFLAVRAEGSFPTGTTWGVFLNGTLSPHGWVLWDNQGNQKAFDAPRGAIQIQVRVQLPDGRVIYGPTINR